MTVLEFPPRESWSSLVSLEFLYGIWVLFPSTKADITFPRVERDRLICVASFNLWPVAPVLACLSDPYVRTKKERKKKGLKLQYHMMREVIHQTWKTVFRHIFNWQALRCFGNIIGTVLMFDIFSQSWLKLRRKWKIKIVKNMQIKIRYPNTDMVKIFFV